MTKTEQKLLGLQVIELEWFFLNKISGEIPQNKQIAKENYTKLIQDIVGHVKKVFGNKPKIHQIFLGIRNYLSQNGEYEPSSLLLTGLYKKKVGYDCFTASIIAKDVLTHFNIPEANIAEAKLLATLAHARMKVGDKVYDVVRDSVEVPPVFIPLVRKEIPLNYNDQRFRLTVFHEAMIKIYEEGKVDAAIELSKKKIGEHPNHPEGYLTLASILVGERDYKNALIVCEEGLKRCKDPLLAQYAAGIAQELYRCTGDKKFLERCTHYMNLSKKLARVSI